MMDFSEYKDIEFGTSEYIRSIQDRLLREHLRYCGAFSPFYRDFFAWAGIDPSDVGLDALADIPAVGKAELGRDNDAFLAADPEKVVDIVFSSGTTGPSTKIAYTEHDLRRLAYNEMQSLGSAGISSEDCVLLTCTMDRCFVAGLAYFLGARSLGAAAVRNGHGTLDGHVDVIGRVSPTVIIGVPSFLLKLAGHMKESGADPAGGSVRTLICIGEPVRGRDMSLLPAGRGLQESWGASVHSTYASSETVTTFCECTEGCGGHLHPELAIVEVLDEDGRAAAPGAAGEVVLTPMGVEGMPLVRFRTGDISLLIEGQCGCGRNSVRLGPILARKDQMIKLKGTTLYPRAIAQVLEEIPAVSEHFLVVDSHSELSDTLTVHVAVSDPAWSAERLAQRLGSRLRVTPDVAVMPLEEVRRRVFSPRYRKPVRFFDRRGK